MKRVLRYDLCLGCGLCEAASKGCKMQINAKGFYSPHPIPEDERLKNICPGIRVRHEGSPNTEAWGDVVAVSNAWAADKMVRHLSSSGGVTSAIAIYLLETGRVDAVLHAGCNDGTYLYNSLHISRSREDILKRNQSRYAPALMFSRLFDILDENPRETYCLIGKPCDIAAARNIEKEYPEYAGRIAYCLSIFCAGMPSYNATDKAIATFGRKERPAGLRYRGDGWPGYFTATYPDGSSARMTYNESWGKILGRHLGFRCKICPDGIGLLADISSGDSWNTKDGYPDFTEAEGRNFCFIRTGKGKAIFDGAVSAGYIEKEELDVLEVKNMQRYQYERRHIVGWRIAVVQIMTGGILHFKGLGYTKMALRTNYLHALKDAWGTFRRLSKIAGGGGRKT